MLRVWVWVCGPGQGPWGHGGRTPAPTASIGEHPEVLAAGHHSVLKWGLNNAQLAAVPILVLQLLLQRWGGRPFLPPFPFLYPSSPLPRHPRYQPTALLAAQTLKPSIHLDPQEPIGSFPVVVDTLTLSLVYS